MGALLDSVPLSGIVRVRDMMFGVKDPFRLDQGDVSFDAPETFKQGIIKALEANHTHYLLTAGVPRLRELCAERMRTKRGIPVEDPEELQITNGGVHALYVLTQSLLEPGDEVILSDPTWPPFFAMILMAGAVPVPCPLHESLDWRFDIDELRSKITPKTKVIYLNSPNNPTGGVLTRADLKKIAAIAQEHNLWVISDEAYDDYVYDDSEHVSIASLPGMYERTFPIFTFSKSYAVTGLRLGYLAIKSPELRNRIRKVCFYTASNTSSIVQYGGIAMLEGDPSCVDRFVRECKERRDLFYQGIEQASAGVFSGRAPKGGMFAFMKIEPKFAPRGSTSSWAMTEHLIKEARIGNVPGVDFSPPGPTPNGEGYIRFCFSRERPELEGALRAMATLFGGKPPE
jgi:aspartate aminotransferase